MSKHDNSVCCCDCGKSVKLRWYESAAIKLAMLGWLVKNGIVLCPGCKHEYEMSLAHDKHHN